MEHHKILTQFLEEKQKDAESRLQTLEYALDGFDWFEKLEDLETWRIFRDEAEYYRSFKNQSTSQHMSFKDRLAAWKAQYHITTNVIERMCLDELLSFLKDKKIDASE